MVKEVLNCSILYIVTLNLRNNLVPLTPLTPGPVLPSLLHPSASPGGISHTDDDFAVAETQSFVCDAAQADVTLDETPQSLDGPESRSSDRASSFQLGLSDSSHQVPEAEEHDREPAEEDWQLQATQLYGNYNHHVLQLAWETALKPACRVFTYSFAFCLTFP